MALVAELWVKVIRSAGVAAAAGYGSEWGKSESQHREKQRDQPADEPPQQPPTVLWAQHSASAPFPRDDRGRHRKNLGERRIVLST